MRPYLITTTVGLALLAACGQGDRETRSGAANAGSETGMADTASTGTPVGEREGSPEGILSRLELANSAEIQTSQLAAERAQSPAVKKMALTLLTHHRLNRKQLEALAKQKGIDLVPASGGSTARDTSGVLALKSFQGAAFDSAYVAGQLEAHRTNLDAIKNQLLPATQDSAVRQFLQKTEVAMEKHQAGLQEIQSQLQR